MRLTMTALTLLPEEVWIHVFMFLPSRDKLNTRASCRFFKSLVDHPALWKNSTVHLKRIGSYKAHFWRLLAKRRTDSVVVLKASVKEWELLAARLPRLSSVTVQLCCDAAALEALGHFRELKQLVILKCNCPSLAGSITALRGLSHLTLCEVLWAPKSDIISAVSQLTNLTSLKYHQSDKPIAKTDLHCMLRCLPNLKHLSLKMGPNQGPFPTDYLGIPKANHTSDGSQLGLTSLELLDYADPILCPKALCGVPSLKKLAVQYRKLSLDPGDCHLKMWLSSLSVLSELNISLGYPLGAYAKSVPRTLQSLSLKGVTAEPTALTDVAQQLPDLLCLHLDLFCLGSPSLLAAVPRLFPSLQILEMRPYQLPEAEFLGLARLSQLKRLVLLDPDPSSRMDLMDLTHKLQMQTNYRVHVICSSGHKDESGCLCVYR